MQVPVLSKTLAKKCIEEFNQDEFELQPDSEMIFFGSDCSIKLSVFKFLKYFALLLYGK